MSIREIRIEDYNYNLPQDRIAQYPLKVRDQSNLLVFRNGEISQTQFTGLPDLLPAGSMIIWNNTKVIPARLQFHKPTGALIEIFLLEPGSPAGYIDMFNQTGSCTWDTIIGNQKKWKGSPLRRTEDSQNGPVELTAEYEAEEGKTRIRLTWTPENLTFAQVLDLFGKTPIPPYLRRDSDKSDKTTYQTVYADLDGSVAAPTAGLHFTPELIDRLKTKDINISQITLHVGSGTFIPVKSETIGDHQMHGETVIVDRKVISELIGLKSEKLTVVGTTTMRSIESLFWLGQKISLNLPQDETRLFVDQWEPYHYDNIVDAWVSLKAILNFMDDHQMDQIQFITRLIIVPGYRFRIVNRLITNFHQPSSTLLLLVSALIGKKWRDVYNYALNNGFRFLSYGDSSLLEMEGIDHD